MRKDQWVSTSMKCIVIAIVLASTQTAHGRTCVEIENIKGHAAHSGDSYKFAPDSFSDSAKHRFCYDGDNGKFDDSEGAFRKFGLNTWIWVRVVEGQTEVVEVWSFDVTRLKALFTRIRGSGDVMPATTAAYAGDITNITSE